MGYKTPSGLERLRGEAARWVVRLSDPTCTETERQEFEAWSEQSLSHVVAYERELAAWNRLDGLRGAPGRLRDDLPGMKMALDKRRLGQIAATLVATLGLLASAFLIVSAPAAYATGVGERRMVVLRDGSQIELNTDTKVEVRMRIGQRRVKLIRGEAVFRVVTAERPMIVVADTARIVTEAGEVAIRMDDAATRVWVSAGAAEVGDSKREDATQVLTPGLEAVYGASRSPDVHAVTTNEVDRALAWRRGAIVLDGQPLVDAVAEFNRYNDKKLVISDARLGSIRLGGYFRTNDVSGFVTALTGAFPVSATRRADGAIHLTAAKERPHGS